MNRESRLPEVCGFRLERGGYVLFICHARPGHRGLHTNAGAFYNERTERLVRGTPGFLAQSYPQVVLEDLIFDALAGPALIAPFDLEARAERLVRFAFPMDPEDGLGRTLELAEALRDPSRVVGPGYAGGNSTSDGNRGMPHAAADVADMAGDLPPTPVRPTAETADDADPGH